MIKELEFLHGTLNQNLGTIIVVGVGNGSYLDEIIALQPDLLVCIEANKQLAASLERRTKKLGNVRIINEWVTPGSEAVQIYEFSNPRYNSLAEPSEKLKSRPNLKLTANNQLSGKPFTELLSELPYSEQKINLLIFSVPGTENMLIQHAAEKLYAFDYILIDPKNSDFYATPWDIKEKVDGFNLSNFNLNENGITGFLYSRSSSREKELQSELTSLKSKHQKQSETLRVTSEENQVLRKQLVQAQEQAKSIEAKNKEQLQQQYNRFEDEKQSLLSESDNLQHTVTELQKRNDDLAAEIKQNSDEIAAERSNKEQLQAYFENQINDIKEREKQHLQILSQMSKQSTKDRLDLEELRKRYNEKIEQEKELIEFIRTMQSKLIKAEKLYDEIQSDNKQLIERKSDD